MSNWKRKCGDGVSAEDQKTKTQSWMKEQTWLIDVLFWSSSWQATLLYITELWRLWRGTTKQHFQSDLDTKFSATQAPVDSATTISAIYDRANDICCYIRNRLTSKTLTVSCLVRLGHIDLFNAAHDQTDCVVSKLTTDNSYFYNNVTVLHYCGLAVICKTDEDWGCLLCLSDSDCSVMCIYFLQCNWQYGKLYIIRVAAVED